MGMEDRPILRHSGWGFRRHVHACGTPIPLLHPVPMGNQGVDDAGIGGYNSSCG